MRMTGNTLVGGDDDRNWDGDFETIRTGEEQHTFDDICRELGDVAKDGDEIVLTDSLRLRSRGFPAVYDGTLRDILYARGDTE